MSSIVELLPDIPRWVWARDLVLNCPYDAFGFEASPLSVAVRERGEPPVYVIGRPSDMAVREAVAAPQARELLAGAEAEPWLTPLLPGWTSERATIWRPGDLMLPDDESARIVDLATIERFPIDPELLGELREAAGETEIAASFVGHRPVAFCYASAVTETLWDVGIDTVEAFRRQGHARRVAAFMIRRMAQRGLRTVWCALASNPASWRLAQSLGFVHEDEIVIFERG